MSRCLPSVRGSRQAVALINGRWIADQIEDRAAKFAEKGIDPERARLMAVGDVENQIENSDLRCISRIYSAGMR